MIKRYTRKIMGDIWSDENKYKTWLKVEILACEAMEQIGKVPKKALSNIKKKANFSVKRIDEIEAETKHDVIAFLTNIAEYVGPDSRYIHMGLTSSDILDTSMSYLLRQAGKIILKDCEKFLSTLKKRAFEHKNTIMVGRSHGIHAEPITFGLKLAVWYDEMCRNQKRCERAVENISFGKMSGAVGTFANTPPSIEAYVCKKLNLKPAPASTQIIQRDRYAEYFTALAIMASSIEKMAIEIRHLQRTEVLEAEEYFSKGQKGSSAMPHKKNPIGCENITGLARLVRSNCMAAFENMALWHERDISHSSVERVIGPDSTILMDFMLHRLTGIINGLVVHPHQMAENLKKTKGLIFSQQFLIKLAEKGVERQKAYVMVQKNAMEVWESGQEFKALIMEDQEIGKYLSKKEIEDVFDVDYHLQHVEDIFARVFN